MLNISKSIWVFVSKIWQLVNRILCYVILVFMGQKVLLFFLHLQFYSTFSQLKCQFYSTRQTVRAKRRVYSLTLVPIFGYVTNQYASHSLGQTLLKNNLCLYIKINFLNNVIFSKIDKYNIPSTITSCTIWKWPLSH